MDSTDRHGADIRRLNYQALVLFREMVRNDKADACLRLGLDSAAADAIERMTLQEIDLVADCGLLLFRLRLGDDRFWVDALRASSVEEDGEMSRLSVGLLALRGQS